MNAWIKIVAVILCCLSCGSIQPQERKQFNWADTTFEIGSYRAIHVVFSFDGPEILPESFPVLDSVINFLQANSNLRVEISSYTDQRGSEVYNNKLSEVRAKTVTNYLEYKGIDPLRLVAKGYGESNPLHSEATIQNARTEAERETLHIQNRRTEIVITGFTQ